MYSIKTNSIYEYEIKKSKFITLLYSVTNINEVNQYLDECKKNYPNATHYCYAYKIDQTQKFSDDGEPGGTAGMPIMNVIEKQNLNYILCIIVRYFGGIKLGAGGLVRAYSNSITEALKENILIELIDGYLVEINTTYDSTKQLDYILKDKEIINKTFNDTITYQVKLLKEDLESIREYDYKIINEIKIEKE